MDVRSAAEMKVRGTVPTFRISRSSAGKRARGTQLAFPGPLLPGRHFTYVMPSVVIAGRPEVPTTTTFSVCLALVLQDLDQIVCR